MLASPDATDVELYAAGCVTSMGYALYVEDTFGVASPFPTHPKIAGYEGKSGEEVRRSLIEGGVILSGEDAARLSFQAAL